MLFLIFQKVIRKKTVPGFLELISILFFNIWKGYKQKTVSILKFMRMLFLIFENGTRKKLYEVF